MLRFYLSLALIVRTTFAICPGFDYAIGELQPLANGINQWTVFDDSCNIVDSLITNQNPCTQGMFGCSPAPILFNQYTNTFTGLHYACGTDPNSGTCNGVVISVCCRDDGK